MRVYAVWRERMSVLEKAIYAMALVAGLIDAEREQFSPNHSMYQWNKWCEKYSANNVSSWRSLFSLTYSRECVNRFKDALILKIQNKCDSQRVLSLRSIFEQVSQHCKCIGFDIMQNTQTLITGTDKSLGCNWVPVQISLKRDLNDDKIFVSCTNTLISMAGSISAWVMDVQNWIRYWHLLVVYETQLNDKRIVHELQELRWQCKLFRCLSVCTQVNSCMSIHPYPIRNNLEQICDFVAGLIQEKYLLAVACNELNNGVEPALGMIEVKREKVTTLSHKVEAYIITLI
jgi:hypothetical protein